MKRKGKGIYQYLQSEGVLETGSDEAIKAARKRYWAQYKAAWRRNKRNTSKSFEIIMNPKEHARIQGAAKMHKRSSTSYIKEAALAYSQQLFLVPDITVVYEIKEALSLLSYALHDALDESYVNNGNLAEVIGIMTAFETKIYPLITEPVLLEQAIRKALQQKPDYQNELVNLINNTM